MDGRAVGSLHLVHDRSGTRLLPTSPTALLLPLSATSEHVPTFQPFLRPFRTVSFASQERSTRSTEADGTMDETQSTTGWSLPVPTRKGVGKGIPNADGLDG